jgi:hypothetical protein
MNFGTFSSFMLQERVIGRVIHCQLRLEFPQQIIIPCMNLPDDNDVVDHTVHIFLGPTHKGVTDGKLGLQSFLDGWLKALKGSYKAQVG